MDTADRAAYLARIDYRGATEPSPAVVADLQLAHLLTVPTLHDDRLIVTAGDDKREEPVAGAGEWRRLAAERFGIDLDRR